MVLILLTGTPGTGKTAVSKIFSSLSGFKIISINDVVGEDYLRIEKGSKVVDPEVISKKIEGLVEQDCIVEGHLSHLLNLDGKVVVLRTHPTELKKRLKKKGFTGTKLEENLEAEAIDVCLIESLERHREVYEIDTTHKKPDEIANHLLEIVQGDAKKFEPGKISWLEDFVEGKVRRIKGGC
jgi:adenylate kinase